MERVEVKRRTARFRTVISFIDKNTELWDEGFIEGNITVKPEGNDGFGYDPIFRPVNRNKTFAQMGDEEKNEISHRGLALARMKKTLKSYFNKGGSIE